VPDNLYDADHDAFRTLARSFFEREVVPNYSQWESDGMVPRDLYRKAGELGLLGVNIPEEFGGGGMDDYRFNAILNEEAGKAMVMPGSMRTHMDVVLPYFLKLSSDEQRARWFPGFASGDLFTAIAMTEPDTGSDIAGVRTSAVRDGDHYVVNGSKTFITGGLHADLVVTLVRTSSDETNRRNGLTLLVIEAGTPGFTKGRKLEKIGLLAQDTVELAFSSVRVPVANRLGDEGAAFGYLGSNLPQERLAIAIGSLAQSRAAFDLTVEYVQERLVFGKPVAHFQNTKFELAAIATDLRAGQALIDESLRAIVAGELTGAEAAMTKLYCTELQGRVVDRCLQLFGGYGYIREYPIARLYTDARVTRIYGGTSEVLKTIISKSLGL
jgi:acyl-CoA dehydrogenase